MKVAKDRNYWLAFFACIAVTVMSLMGKDGVENIKWFILSDINVAIFLFIAWMFDDE